MVEQYMNKKGKMVYPHGKHPNTLALLDKGRKSFNENYQPEQRRVQTGKNMKTLIGEIFDRKISVKDVIVGANRKVTVAEATLLTLVDCAIKKQQPWAIERLMKEGIHDGMDKVQVVDIISPATQFILKQAGIAEQAKLIDGEYEEVSDGDAELKEILEEYDDWLD